MGDEEKLSNYQKMMSEATYGVKTNSFLDDVLAEVNNMRSILSKLEENINKLKEEAFVDKLETESHTYMTSLRFLSDEIRIIRNFSEAWVDKTDRNFADLMFRLGIIYCSIVKQKEEVE